MIKFGTGGWRAVIADDFTKANVRLLTAGLCRLMEQEGHGGATICVGYDRRFLSKEAAHWAAEVLAGFGFHPFVLDRAAPTPLVMYTVKEKGLPYGMAITASHNPAIYNGIKVFTAGGRDADQTVTGRIEAQIAQLCEADIKSVEYDEGVQSGAITEGTTINEYLDSILALVNVEAIKKARLKIVLDPMYGVSQTSLRTIFMTCRCDLDVIHDRHDTLFGGRLPAPNANTLLALQNFVVENHCDLGVATDGDADRLGVIDDQGAFVHPNQLLVLLYYYLIKYRGWSGPCVRNNSTTHLLDRIAQGLGQTCYEVPVGFKHISAKMLQTNAVIGGESSGGLTVRGHIAGKDGIYAASLLAEMLAVTGKSLSQLYREITDQYGQVYSAEADFRMTPAAKAALQERIFVHRERPAFDDPIDHVSLEDGCKVYFSDGSWVICRFSGTEPLLRMAAEAGNAQTARRYVDTWKTFLAL